jgi:hypothetical protein
MPTHGGVYAHMLYFSGFHERLTVVVIASGLALVLLVVLVALTSTVVKDGDNRCPEGAKLSKPESKMAFREWR